MLTVRPRGGVEPFYFGTPSKPLFGCYHAPQSSPTRDCGVVLCYPMGQEYIRSHRAYRQLAIELSEVGFPVLRFDFYGCGDSSGDCAQGEIRQWLIDIATAIGELRRRGGGGEVCLMGLRLGGTLAMMAGAARGDVQALVLWDPVASGRAYLEESATMHREMLPYAHAQPTRDSTGAQPTEIMGFPLTSGMRTALEHIDLLAIRQQPAHHILVIDSCEEASDGCLVEHLKRTDAQLASQRLPGPTIWAQDPYQALVPRQILQAVVAWIAEVYS